MVSSSTTPVATSDDNAVVVLAAQGGGGGFSRLQLTVEEDAGSPGSGVPGGFVSVDNGGNWLRIPKSSGPSVTMVIHSQPLGAAAVKVKREAGGSNLARVFATLF